MGYRHGIHRLGYLGLVSDTKAGQAAKVQPPSFSRLRFTTGVRENRQTRE